MTTPKNLLILGAILIAVALLLAWLFRPLPPVQNTGNLTEQQENELKASLLIAEGRADSLQRELDKSKAAGKIAENAFKSEIKAKLKTITELKNRPVVIQVEHDYPEIDSLHDAYDSALLSYEGRILSLTNEMYQRDRLNGQLIANFESRLSQTEQLLSESQLENEQLKKQNRKLKRGRVLRNVVIPVVAVGCFILGVHADH